MSARNLLENKKILIVDDESDVLETLSDLLFMCTITKADDFDQAQKQLTTRNFDLALLDIMGVDGYRLLEIAKQRNITAVMLTAHAFSPDSIKRSHAKGAAFYLPKERMIHIEEDLGQVFADIQKGKNPWERWIDRLGKYCERHFGPDWQSDDKDFWTRFPFY